MWEPQQATPGQRVLAERRRRGWSARTAAQVAGISNTTWSAFERSDNLTDTIRQGVADAFGWSTDWPEQPALTEPTAQQMIVAAMDERLHAALEAADADRHRIIDKLDEVLEELKAHRVKVEPDGGVDLVLERLAAAVEMVAGHPASPPDAREAPRAS